MMDTPGNSQTENRIVRVFVSSTFKDMQEEREELIKFIFPKLRQRCRERRVEFEGVDLRWGITDEEKSEGKVLQNCLREIEKCRPYFIGLLGDRYGWVPEQIDREILETQGWLSRHAGKSITELEILHGVLENPKMKGLSFFYLRDKKLSDTVESLLSKEPLYVKEPASSKIKLNNLKKRIKSGGYHTRNNYPSVKYFGEMVLEDLWMAIEERYPEEKIPSALEQSRLEHEGFAALRRKVYICRDEDMETLNAHALSDHPPLVVQGESGSGKSALIANWMEKYKKDNPLVFSVAYYIGGTNDSSDCIRMLMQIMEQIKDRYKLEGEEKDNRIPVEPGKVIEAFPIWLEKAADKGKMILVLDGLNQLENSGNMADLGWLPSKLHANLRLVLSTLPGRTLDTLRKRTLPELYIHPMGKDEKKEYIIKYLEQYGKKMGSSHIEKIIRAGQTSNPLYLRTLLEELRVFGIYEKLEQRIDHYLRVESVDALFNLVLERLEGDYENERSGLVRDVTSFIWASRNGLSESELLEILGSDTGQMPRAYWSPLYLSLEEFLVSRSGHLSFFHDAFRKAVQERYLSEAEQKKSHAVLAQYFQKIADPKMDRSWKTRDERGFMEWPYHCIKSMDWDALGQLLCALPFIRKKAQLGKIRDLIVDYQLAETECTKIGNHIAGWNDWKYFVTSQAHIIETYVKKYPAIVFQQAFNLSKNGSVSCAATNLLKDKKGSSGVWFERVNRPLYPTDPTCLFTLEGHSSPVHAIAVSQEGSTVISGSADGTVQLWSSDLGICLNRLTGHTNGVCCVDFLSDNFIISGSWDHSIRLWFLETGECLHEFKGHSGPVSFLKTVDDSHFISGSFDGTLRFWNTKEKKCERLFNAHSKAVTHAVLAEDNRTLISASEDGGIVFWDLQHETPLAQMVEKHGEVLHLTIVSQHRVLASYEDGAILLWNLDSACRSLVFKGHEGPVAGTALFSFDTFVSWSFDGDLKLWSLKTGQCLKTLGGHTEPVTDLAVLKDGMAVSVSLDRSIRYWDLIRGEPINVIHGHRSGINAIVCHNNGKVFSAGFDNTIKVWNLKSSLKETDKDTADTLPQVICQARTLGKVFLMDPDTAAVETMGPKTIHLWDLEKGTYKGQIRPGSDMESEYFKKVQKTFMGRGYDFSRISSTEYKIAIDAFFDGDARPDKIPRGMGILETKKKELKTDVFCFVVQLRWECIYPVACSPYAFAYDSSRTIAFDAETREPHILKVHGLSSLQDPPAVNIKNNPEKKRKSSLYANGLKWIKKRLT